jgi:hypothetical protein
MAVHPEHRVGQSEAETATWPEFSAFQDETSQLGDATLNLSNLPQGFLAVVDGQPIDAGAASLSLRPGTHFLHAVRDGVLHGRARIEVAPGDSLTFPVLVTRDEVGGVHVQVLSESTTGYHDDVKRALEELTAFHAGPVFVAAVNDNGRVVILPYARGAMLIAQRPVTFLFTGDLGPVIVVSPLFDDDDGSLVTAPGFSGELGIEFGIYNAAVIGGMDLAITPGHTVRYANEEETANITTSVLPQPWGGIGVYGLRPVGDAPYMLLAATAGWNGPAHIGVGGRVTFGLPTDGAGWARLTLGANTAARSMWDEGDDKTPMQVFFARFGFGTGF